MDGHLNVCQRPSEAHCELQREGDSFFGNDTVDIAIPHVVNSMKVRGERQENLLGQRRLLYVPQNRTHLPGCNSQIVITKFLELPVFTESLGPAIRPEPPANSHFDSGEKVLDDELGLDFPLPLPGPQHIDQIRCILGDVGEFLVHVPVRLRDVPLRPPQDISLSILIPSEGLPRNCLDSSTLQDLLPLLPVQFPGRPFQIAPKHRIALANQPLQIFHRIGIIQHDDHIRPFCMGLPGFNLGHQPQTSFARFTGRGNE